MTSIATSTTTSMNASHPLGERLVDAREAAHCLNLPMYLLTHPKERRRIGLPHYRVGKMVRFKVQELIDWIQLQGEQPDA